MIGVNLLIFLLIKPYIRKESVEAFLSVYGFLAQRFPSADPTAGLAVLSFIMFDVNQGLLIEQVVGIDCPDRH